MEDKAFLRRNHEIKASLLVSVRPVESPGAILLGGQPGAGKSSIVPKILNNEDNFVFINGDDLRLSIPIMTKKMRLC